jgi:hypothetical protein
MDLDIDVAGGAIDRDKGVAFAALQGWQVLQVDVDEANTSGLEDAGFWLVRFGACADAVALQATVDGAAGQLRVDASPHHLTMSSSGNCSDIRSSQTSCSSIAVRLICRVFGVCGRSATVLRPRQRRIVVSLTPSSAANSATDLLLRWM